MSDNAASLKTMTVMGSRRRTAVSSSAATIMKPPSPVKHTTRCSGQTSWAAMAAGRAKPMVASPFEIRNSPGSTACQYSAAWNMWAPASTVAIVPACVSSRVSWTTRCGANPGTSISSARWRSRRSRSTSATSQSA